MNYRFLFMAIKELSDDGTLVGQQHKIGCIPSLFFGQRIDPMAIMTHHKLNCKEILYMSSLA